MSGKRRAANDLNHENWDQEESSEEGGAFSIAPKEVLEKRVIRTAKRRSRVTTGSEPKASIFSGFGGFNQTQAGIPASFDFLANLTNGKAEPSRINGTTASKPNNENKLDGSSSLVVSSVSKLGSLEKNKVEISNVEKIEKNDSASKANTSASSEEYFSKLRGLNESVSNWIKSNVEENPVCILTPIFQDYEKYLKEIQNSLKHAKEKSTRESVIEIEATRESNNKSGNADSIFKSDYFKISTPSSTTTSATSLFTSTLTSSSSNQGILSFSKKNSLNSEEKPFSFGNGKPFSFTNVDTPKDTESRNQEEEPNENEDEPPKVEFTPVVEENSVFDKRCKIFVKKDANFSERGVGNLFIKPVENSEKYQLIVRANTSLGNLLVNILLSESIPKQRMGKNNVMLVCIPTTDAKPPPVPILIRVKTSDEADELLSVLQQYSK